MIKGIDYHIVAVLEKQVGIHKPEIFCKVQYKAFAKCLQSPIQSLTDTCTALQSPLQSEAYTNFQSPAQPNTHTTLPSPLQSNTYTTFQSPVQSNANTTLPSPTQSNTVQHYFAKSNTKLSTAFITGILVTSSRGTRRDQARPCTAQRETMKMTLLPPHHMEVYLQRREPLVMGEVLS